MCKKNILGNLFLFMYAATKSNAFLCCFTIFAPPPKEKKNNIYLFLFRWTFSISHALKFKYHPGSLKGQRWFCLFRIVKLGVVVAVLLLQVVYICGKFVLIFHIISRAVVLKIKLMVVRLGYVRRSRCALWYKTLLMAGLQFEIRNWMMHSTWVRWVTSLAEL